MSLLLGLHPSGTEPIGVYRKAVGWQVAAASCVPVQTTPPSWPLAVATAAMLTAPIKREATRRPTMIALWVACFTVAAKDVTVGVCERRSGPSQWPRRGWSRICLGS